MVLCKMAQPEGKRAAWQLARKPNATMLGAQISVEPEKWWTH